MVSTNNIYPRGCIYPICCRLNSGAAQQTVGGPRIHNCVTMKSLYDHVSEETMSNGVGFINYDKDLNVETKAGLNGQSNIEATKEIAFEGMNGAEITSTITSS